MNINAITEYTDIIYIIISSYIIIRKTYYVLLLSLYKVFEYMTTAQVRYISIIYNL